MPAHAVHLNLTLPDSVHSAVWQKRLAVVIDTDVAQFFTDLEAGLFESPPLSPGRRKGR